MNKNEVKYLFRATSNRYKSFSKHSKKIIKAMEGQGNIDCIVDLKIKGKSLNTVKVRYIEIIREGQETLRFICNVSQAEFSLKEIETMYRLR